MRIVPKDSEPGILLQAFKKVVYELWRSNSVSIKAKISKQVLENRVKEIIMGWVEERNRSSRSRIHDNATNWKKMETMEKFVAFINVQENWNGRIGIENLLENNYDLNLVADEDKEYEMVMNQN